MKENREDEEDLYLCSSPVCFPRAQQQEPLRNSTANTVLGPTAILDVLTFEWKSSNGFTLIDQLVRATYSPSFLNSETQYPKLTLEMGFHYYIGVITVFVFHMVI